MLAITYSDTEPRGTLRYRLLTAFMRPPTSSLADPGDWGHEYVRHLAAELGKEYNLREQTEVPKAKPEVGVAGLNGETEDKDSEKVKPQIPRSVGTSEDLHNLALACAKFLLKAQCRARYSRSTRRVGCHKSNCRSSGCEHL
jgi:26S proteasome regulatory subunit N1